MKNKDICKGCSSSVWIPSESIKKMVEEILSSREFDVVTENIYNMRLESCHNCVYFDYGTTCRQCGCIVQVRALLKGKDCPHPKLSRW